MTDAPRDERDPLGLLPDFHRSTRMPLDAVVRLHFEGTVAYQNGFAANVSALGMFVKHPDPPEVGTRLVFEFVLGDERKPVQGGGIVAWVRERYEGPGRPAGVGIQFTELDALSRQHIAEALFEYLETQLGVEVADHPDVPNLLAAMPRATTFEALDAEPAAEPASPSLFDFSTADRAAQTDSPATPATSFRLFDDAPSGDTDDDPIFAEAGPDLFAPVAPPEDFEPLPEEPVYGAARRGESPRWLPVAIVVALVTGGLAAWWFVWGPGAEGSASAPAAAQVATPVARDRPRLDPQPGRDATLAETVGVAADGTEPSSAPDEKAAAANDAGIAPAAPVVEAPPLVAAAPAPAAAEREAPPTSGERFDRLLDIEFETFEGGTNVILVGDGFFPAGSYRWFEMGSDKPRVLVRLTGVSEGFARATIAAGTAELVGVRTGYHEKPGGNELHVVLDLGAGKVRVESVDPVRNRLVVRLRQP